RAILNRNPNPPDFKYYCCVILGSSEEAPEKNFPLLPLGEGQGMRAASHLHNVNFFETHLIPGSNWTILNFRATISSIVLYATVDLCCPLLRLANRPTHAPGQILLSPQ